MSIGQGLIAGIFGNGNRVCRWAFTAGHYFVKEEEVDFSGIVDVCTVDPVSEKLE